MLFRKKKKGITYNTLRDKWAKKHAEIQQDFIAKNSEVVRALRDKSKHFAVGSLGGMLLFSTPITTGVSPETTETNEIIFDDIDMKMFMITDLSKYLPKDPTQSLSSGQEKIVTEILSRDYGLEVKAEIDGKRLERNYGLIGAEQHLMRYPGDTMGSHFQNPEDAQKYFSSGMAPGRGAFGYFTYSRDTLDQRAVDMEKYYIAVQTFRSDGYLNRTREYVDFFKFRKMLVLNPHNGKAVVAVIGDAGPGVSTGKHLGGSPEVMKHLERVDGKQKGPVLFFFVNDPSDTVPLGPIEPGGVKSIDIAESVGGLAE